MLLPKLRPVHQALAATLVCVPTAWAQQPATPAPAPSTISARIAGLDRREGFVPIVLDHRKGQVLLEFPADSTRLLFCYSLATGLGSNPVGLDRGANGDCQVTRFDRSGDKVLVVFENWNYRSSSPDADLARTVAESFAPSTVAALPVAAEEAGRLLVDATGLVLRDWLDVTGTLQRSGQGTFTLATDRSTFYAAHVQAYPDNSEIEVSLTFQASGAPGPIVNQIAPDGRAITLRQHLSLVRLPDAGYRPRAHDPRMGFFGITFKDYAQPPGASLEQRWIARHRLERVDPRDPDSPIRNPIVYYVDRGIPEPLRTATLEGARFWEQAFDRAGLKGGFRVELLPEGADPLDVRYNVVQWVNRNERGWSIGGSLSDPRTGQILKGMARMDSHRNRTSANLFAALAGAGRIDTHFVLGRVRQVTAHEIGHTLGLAHNYIASVYGADRPGRGSVMDYPAPRVRVLPDGEIDVAEPYASGPGAFDVLAIRWGYGIFPPESERDSLEAIVREGLARGLIFLSDADARPAEASDPRTNLWDDLSSPVQFLRAQMAVRRAAMARFGLGNLDRGAPVALLQERFAPLYFWHRFAVFSLAKTLGGMEYHNAVNGDGQVATRPVPAAAQRAALAQLLETLEPEALAIPDTVLALLGPRPFGWQGSVELFRSATAPAFDELGAARTLAQYVIDNILNRARAARLIRQPMRDPAALGLGEVIDRLVAATWDGKATTPREAALRRVTQRALADRLVQLAADKDADPDVRALADLRVGQLAERAKQRAAQATRPELERAHWAAIAADLAGWRTERRMPAATAAFAPPPGDPFGLDEEF